MALGTMASKCLSAVNEAATFAETILSHQSKSSLHNDFMTNIVSRASHKNQRPQGSCSESVSWFGPQPEESYFSKTTNSDGSSSSLEQNMLVPETLHLQDQSLNYNSSSASHTSSANVITYASSAGSFVHNASAPLLDLATSTVAEQFRTDTHGESPNGYTSSLINNYTSTIADLTSPGVTVPSMDNFLSGSCPTFNPYGFSTDAASISWKKPFSQTSEIGHVFGDKIPEIDYESPGQQYPTFNQHFYDIGGESSYNFQEFSNAYLSRDDDLPFNNQTHPTASSGEQRGTHTNPAYAFSTNTLALTKPYRSFSSELNSPNLPHSEDTDMDFEFPLQLGLGVADFDSFMSTVENENNINISRVSHKTASIGANIVSNHHTDFGSTDNNCIQKYKRDSLLQMEPTVSKTTLPTSESGESKLISGSNEQQCLNIGEGIPVSQQMSRLLINRISKSGISDPAEGNHLNQWLGCHIDSETTNHRTTNYELTHQKHLSAHRTLTSLHDVTKHQDSTSSVFGIQEYPKSVGNNKRASHDLRTHNHLRTSFDMATHKAASDTDKATQYSSSTPVFGGHEYQHTSSCNFLNVGHFLNVANDSGNFEHTEIKRCSNTHPITPGITIEDVQEYSGISDIGGDSLPIDSHGYLRRNERCSSFNWQEESEAHGYRSWSSRENAVGRGGTSYAAVENGYCKKTQGQETQKFLDPSSDLLYAGFSEQNFRVSDCPSTTHTDISSTTKTGADSVEDFSDRDSYHDSTVEDAVLSKLSRRDFRECTSNESGQRALVAVIKQTHLGAECFDSNLVKSAIDHIIMNRPRTISNPMGKDTISRPHRHLEAMPGSVSEATSQHPEDNACQREGRRKRRKVSKHSSEDVTTTTRTPSPTAPSTLSSSSSPSASLTSGESFPATALIAGVTLLSSSTTENNNNNNNNNNSSNVSSSSKPDKRRPSVLPPCRVCCSKASGLHYGVVTCEACNGFFRRSLKRGAIYMCSKEKKCDVNGKKRGECSHCRYKKCLTVGMSKSAVKTGRYSDKTRLAYAIETEAQNKPKLLLNDFPEAKAASSQIANIHEIDIGESSLLEFNLLEKQFKHLRQSSPHLSSAENAAKVTPLYECNLPEMPATTFPEYLSEIGLSNMRSIILEQWLGQYLSFAKRVPGFNILSLNDQTTLVRAAWLEVWLLEAHKEFSSDMQVTATSPGIHREIETVFGSKSLELCYRLSTRLEELNIFEDELTLVQMLCLTDPLRYGLDTPEQVSSLQWLMSECLLRELEKNHPDGPQAFSEIHSLLTDLKAACHDSQPLNNDCQLQYSPTQEAPLLQEMLTSSAP